MINALWLLIIIPASSLFGFWLAAILSANNQNKSSKEENIHVDK